MLSVIKNYINWFRRFEDMWTIAIHRYKLYVPYGKTTARYNYFSYRVSRIWNTLPLHDVDFQSVHRFRNSLTANILVRYWKLNFI